MYDAILDRYLTDRGAGNVMIGISFTMYGIPFALLAARGGRLADRQGAFRLSLVSIALVVPLTAAYGLLTVPLIIMGVFLLEGSVQALGVPASQAVVAEAAPLGRASAAQGLAGSMNLAAAAVSAFTAPIVYERWGAGVTFTAAAALVALCGALAAGLHRPALVARRRLAPRTCPLGDHRNGGHRGTETGQLRRSTIMAMPWPPPTHMLSMPKVLSSNCRPLMRVVMIRAPVMPNGWPSAIAPPCTFSLSMWNAEVLGRAG